MSVSGISDALFSYIFVIRMDLGVDWEHVFRNREAINTAWTVKVTNK